MSVRSGGWYLGGPRVGLLGHGRLGRGEGADGGLAARVEHVTYKVAPLEDRRIPGAPAKGEEGWKLMSLFLIFFYLLLLLLFVFVVVLFPLSCCCCGSPQWGTADTEIKVLPGENTELRHSPFKAWSRSVYIHACYAYCQGFLSCLFLPFRFIHLHFFPKPLPICPVLAVANT